MKNLLCVFLCTIVVFCLSACIYQGQSDTDTVTGTSKNTSTQEPTDLSMLHNEYALILDNIVKAYPWNDDDLIIVPENPELSYMYRRSTALSEIGFALIDLDVNGQEELIISDPNKFVYDVYTISNDKIVHLFASGERNYYILRENRWIEKAWSGSAASSGHDFYQINDGKLDFVERITLDAYHALDAGLIHDLSEANGDNCFFRSNSEDEKDYKTVSSAEAIKAIDNYQNANKELEIEYTFLSDYKK